MTSTTHTAETSYVPLWRVRLSLFVRGFKNSWSIFAENPIGLIGFGFIVFFGLFALAHPILMNTVWEEKIYDPVNGFDIEIPFHPSPPSAKHLLGTDPLGRDVLSQLMYSTRYEFALGLISAVVTVLPVPFTTRLLNDDPPLVSACAPVPSNVTVLVLAVNVSELVQSPAIFIV